MEIVNKSYLDTLKYLEEKGVPIPKKAVTMAKYNPKHDLKSWTGLFEPLYTGAKKHDIRVLDRDYQVGDVCLLREYEATTKEYTGRWVVSRITYITSNQHTPCAFSPFALHPSSGVLSYEFLDRGEG